jgi:peptide/nickel transport system substrate-binding protein
VQQIVKQAAGKAGIEMELKNVQAATFFASDPANPDTFTHFYADLQMMGYPSAGGPDPEWLLSRFTSWEIPQKHNKWQGQNAPRWRSEDYDRLFRAAQSELDPAARAALFMRLNDQLVQGGAVIPMMWYADVAAIANSLHGVGWSGWDLLFWRLAYWFRQG